MTRGDDRQTDGGPGARLRAAREASGLGIGEVAEQLQLLQYVVRALEQDEYGRLRGDTFVRGCSASIRRRSWPAGGGRTRNPPAPRHERVRRQGRRRAALWTPDAWAWCCCCSRRVPFTCSTAAVRAQQAETRWTPQ